MRYTNLNPVLTTEILENAGFSFDGYYYTKPWIPIRFNQESDGFKPSFEDPSMPIFQRCITTYVELVGLIHGMLQMYIQMNLVGKTFNSEDDQRRYLVELIKDYYNFDPDLKFVSQFTRDGFVNIPNNEYTYTILDGNIGKFLVKWTDGSDLGEVEFECSPQCICWDYVKSVITDITQREFSDDLDIDVFLNTTTGLVRFIGTGIPKLVLTNENSR